MNKIKPFSKFILIEPLELKNKYNLKIAGSDGENKAEVAKVLAVGKEVEEIKVGQRVVFKNYNLFVSVHPETKKELIFLEEGEVMASI